MLLNKACPRCTGDLGRVQDVGETYYSCLQCGHIVYAAQAREMERASTARAQQDRPRAA
jgi:tRNA(Ile2) C34 agmatinyltransferase TiaS